MKIQDSSGTAFNRIIVAAIVLLLAGVGLYVRLYGLMDFFLSPDDLLHFYVFNEKNVIDVYKQSTGQLHPPLYFILLHFFVKIGDSEIFLRLTSILPGVCIILVSYYMGREISGVVSGLATAYIATFSFGPLLISQVLRSYIYMLVFLAAGTYYLVLYLKNNNKSHLFLYLMFIFLSICMHYSAIFIVGGIGAYLLVRLALQRKPLIEYLKIILYHLPHAIILFVFFFSHVYSSLKSGYYGAMLDSYLKPHVVDSLGMLLEKLKDINTYFFYFPDSYIFLLIPVLGIISLWLMDRRETAAIIVLSFIISLVVALLKIYPFGGIRQSLFLFPFSAVVLGALAQYIFNAAAGLYNALMWEKAKLFIESNGKLFAVFGAICFISITIVTTYFVKTYDCHRRSLILGGIAWMEFPLKRENYNSIMDYVDANCSGKGNVILTNRQTIRYFFWRYNDFEREIHAISDILYSVYFPYNGMRIFYVNTFGFKTERDFKDALLTIKRNINVDEDSLLWLFNIGWTGSMKDILASNPAYADFFKNDLDIEAGLIYSAKAQEFYSEPER